MRFSLFFFLFLSPVVSHAITCQYLKDTTDFPATYGSRTMIYSFHATSDEATEACHESFIICGSAANQVWHNEDSESYHYYICDDCQDRCPTDNVCDPVGVSCEPEDCDEAFDTCSEQCATSLGGTAEHTCTEDADGKIIANNCNCSPDDDGDCYERRQSCKGTCGSLNASFMCAESSGGIYSSCSCSDDSEGATDNKDSDGDGIPDYEDDDDDNDGDPDVTDPDDDGDGNSDSSGPGLDPSGLGPGPDTDGDGDPDVTDPDDDGDGLLDEDDADQDGDGNDDKAEKLDPTGKTCDELISDCEARCTGGTLICIEDPETGLAKSGVCTCPDGKTTEDGQTTNKWLESIDSNTSHIATSLNKTNQWLETVSGKIDLSYQQDKDRNLLLGNISQNVQTAVVNQGRQLTATKNNGDKLDTIANLIASQEGSVIGNITVTGSGTLPDDNVYDPVLGDGFDPVPEDEFSQGLSEYIATGIPLISYLEGTSLNLSSSSSVLDLSIRGRPVHIDFTPYQGVLDVAGNVLLGITIVSGFILIIARIKG